MRFYSLIFTLLVSVQPIYAAKMSCGYGCKQWFNQPVTIDNLDIDALKWQNVDLIEFRSMRGTLDNEGILRFENGRYSNSDLLQKLEVPMVIGKQFFFTTTQPGRCESVLVCKRTE